MWPLRGHPQLFARLPQTDAAFDGVAVGPENDVRRKPLHQLGVPSAEQDVFADQRVLQPFHDVEHGLAPALLSAELQPGFSNVLLVGSSLAVGEMGELQRDDDAIEHHCGSESGSDPEEQHAAAAVTSERLHGRIVHKTDGFLEHLLVGKVDPSSGQVVRLGQRAVIDDRTGVSDRDRIVLPPAGAQDDLLGHLLRVHGGPRRDLQGRALQVGCDLHVSSTDVDDENIFHVGKNTARLSFLRESPEDS